MSWTGNLAERRPLASVGDLQVYTQKKISELMVNSGVDGYTKTPNQRKILRKTQKTTKKQYNNNLPKPKYKPSGGVVLH